MPHKSPWSGDCSRRTTYKVSWFAIVYDLIIPQMFITPIKVVINKH